MDRRVQIEDKHAELELQTYNLLPERWGQLYRDEILGGVPGDMGNAFGPGVKEIPVTDIDDIREWDNNKSRARGITGEQAFQAYSDPLFPDPMNVLGYAEGTGRRV